ncbi:hypothetical protein AVEN_92375-1 [Araneus ventricosus]|uniref:Peptidase A2 domain-containing protein n=1 Tax=Araneus ventricosus TaxID=182803 RepID=A0A4Y2AJK0_ARAVE|nr:hypothetical protein AVEN_92375-1 [Araneus ventricosus]
MCWYHKRYRKKVQKALSLLFCKLDGSSEIATTDVDLLHVGLFVFDKPSGLKFLVDSGAAVNCYSKNLVTDWKVDTAILCAANNTKIKRFVPKVLNLNLGLRRVFPFNFIIVEVSHPIIKADFLERFELLVDVKTRRLIDSITTLKSKGLTSLGPSLGLTLVSMQNPYHVLLVKYPKVLGPNQGIQHQSRDITHYIETFGSPVFSKDFGPVPVCDLKKYIKSSLQMKWQRHWDQEINNKLHSIKPIIENWSEDVNRKRGTILTRLRIGHTRFTHRHLLLGHLVTKHGIQPLPEKIKALTDFPLPKFIDHLRRFLAMINFYHRFLKDADKMQACLHDLTKGKSKKDKTPLSWSENQKLAFESVKKAAADAELLAQPVSNAKLSLVTDFAMRAVLQQKLNNEFQPLGFFSLVNLIVLNKDIALMTGKYWQSIQPLNNFVI